MVIEMSWSPLQHPSPMTWKHTRSPAPSLIRSFVHSFIHKFGLSTVLSVPVLVLELFRHVFLVTTIQSL